MTTRTEIVDLAERYEGPTPSRAKRLSDTGTRRQSLPRG